MLLNQALNLPFHQSEVDFVIPNLSEDLRLYVDPFLFYKSGNREFQAVHAVLRRFFEVAVEQVKSGNKEVARRMMDFPEVTYTMLGLSTGSHSGRGMGPARDQMIYDEIVSNKDILERGIDHLAEMQLLIENVGFDMISDMCSNIAKPFFIHYTQVQCQLHGIPLERGLCVNHVFDWDELDWDDQSADLPLNPQNGHPILFVPKSVVRRFPDVDYQDFWNSIYRYILRDREIHKSIQSLGRPPKITWKEINEKYHFCKATVVRILHEEPSLKRRYLRHKEKTTVETATPVDLGKVEGTDHEQTPPERLIAELSDIRPGNADAKKYERLMVRILTRLFSPPLADPREQVKSADGREIIDLTFYNAATSGFWHDIKLRHDSTSIIIELKNMNDLTNTEFFQIGSRLNDLHGRFGILISRSKDGFDEQRAHRLLQDRKIVLVLTDEDIVQMLTDYGKGLPTNLHLSKCYRTLLEAA